MTKDLFIAGEWGSVAMRLSLCRPAPAGVTVLDTVTGGGVIGCSDFEAAFLAAAGPWLATHGPIPVFLAGMIGSTIGWRDSGYVAAPAGMADIAHHLTTITVRGIDIHLTPGLTCRNIFGLPDLVRGEEMQVLGWLQREPEAERRLVCLPGRHTKWLLTQDRTIAAFFTAMNGELEDVLLAHSLLGKGVDRGSLDLTAFDAGVAVIAADATLSLNHALFATRSRLVLGEHGPAQAAAFLSGLLIGGDVRDSLSAHRARGLVDGPVVVLGHGVTQDLYARAFERLDTPVTVVAPDDSLAPCAFGGLHALLAGGLMAT